MREVDEYIKTCIDLPENQNYPSQKLVYTKNWFSKQGFDLCVDRIGNVVVLLLFEREEYPRKLFCNKKLHLLEDDIDYELVRFVKRATTVIEADILAGEIKRKVDITAGIRDNIEVVINDRDIKINEGNRVVVLESD